MKKKLGIPMFIKPEVTATAHNHPLGHAFYKNLVDIVSPEYNAGVRCGTGLVLGATNSLPLDTLIGGYITYQTGGLTVTQLQEGVDFTGATYTLVDDTYRWAYVNENPFSEADLTAITEEPNKIVEFAMDGTGLTNTKGVDDKFYGFRENSGEWCVDALAGYGAEQLQNNDFSTGDLTGWSETGTGTITYEDGSIRVVGGGDATSIRNTSTATTGDFVVFVWDILEVTGSVTLRPTGFDSGGDITITEKGVYSAMVIASKTGSIDVLSMPLGSENSCLMAYASSREATASEIASYTSTIRTATANSQTSIQWTCAELDGAGVPTAYNSTPNTAIMHSDISISTGFKPNIGQYSIEETVTGELQDFGSELVVNGTFDADTDWTKQGGATISNGNAVFTNVGNVNGISQPSTPYVSGVTYLCTFTIKSISLGGVYIRIGAANATNIGETFDTVGTHATEITWDGVGSTLNVLADGTTTATIDNVSVKELTTKTQRTEARLLTHTDNHLGVDEINSTPPTLVNSTGGAAISPTFSSDTDNNFSFGVGTVGTSDVYPYVDNNSTIPLQNGKTYLMSFDIVVNSGTCILTLYRIGSDGSVSQNRELTTGRVSYTHTSSSDSDSIRLFFDGRNEFDISVTNWTVKEVSTQNKYYIDGLEQDVTPALPDPAVTINLNDTAVIGYPDTIQSRSADFKVHSEVIVP